MAIEDKYINTEVAAGKLGNPAQMQGMSVFGFCETFEIATADSDGSVYRIADLPGNAILTQLLLNCDALTSGTDYDVGLYKSGVSGAAIDKDVFLDGEDISGGHAIGSEQDAMEDVAMENLTKKIYEHAGHTVSTKHDNYCLALTGNTVGSAGGTVTIRGQYILG